MADNPLAGLDEVDWSSFPTPWAHADPRPFDVAGNLRDLGDEDPAVAEEALLELEEFFVNYHGTLAAAAPRAIPFMARILGARRGDQATLRWLVQMLVGEWCGPAHTHAANQVLSRDEVAGLVALLPEDAERAEFERRLSLAPDPEIALPEGDVL